MKTLAKLWLITIFVLIVVIIFFICPVGLMIIAIVKWSLGYFLGGLIWLITSVALVDNLLKLVENLIGKKSREVISRMQPSSYPFQYTSEKCSYREFDNF